ncbi:unnamed protein product [Owenia fusiformis]|uniref:Uncharacterized protein n=1 Tax=Owenia fusiformis TaxID=6347 RepID=A0A8J1TS27_OWEFU|nr:unnamed protein product [Owenia fusiformis]
MGNSITRTESERLASIELTGGQIAGIVIGIIFGILVIAALIAFFVYWTKKRSKVKSKTYYNKTYLTQSHPKTSTGQPLQSDSRKRNHDDRRPRQQMDGLYSYVFPSHSSGSRTVIEPPHRVQTVPVQNFPVQNVPIQSVPVQTLQAHSVPVETVPLQTVQAVNTVPKMIQTVRTVPVQTAQAVQGVPVQTVQTVQGVPVQTVQTVQGVPTQTVQTFQRVPVQTMPVQTLRVEAQTYPGETGETTVKTSDPNYQPTYWRRTSAKRSKSFKGRGDNYSYDDGGFYGSV